MEEGSEVKPCWSIFHTVDGFVNVFQALVFLSPLLLLLLKGGRRYRKEHGASTTVGVVDGSLVAIQ